jgi:hypothetical protein
VQREGFQADPGDQRRGCRGELRGEAFGLGLFGECLALCDGEAAAQLTHERLAVPAGREVVPIATALLRLERRQQGYLSHGCGAALIRGGEINEFVRRIVMVVLVIAVLVGANSLLTTLFSSGAMITTSTRPAPHIALS